MIGPFTGNSPLQKVPALTHRFGVRPSKERTHYLNRVEEFFFKREGKK
jgi:hypothetical protein